MNLAPVMGMTDFIDTALAAENDRPKQRYLTRTAKRRIDCLFNDVAVLNAKRAPCVFHNGDCSPSKSGRMDWVSLGPPCTPYTRRSARKVVDAPNHKKFDALWGPVVAWLKSPEGPHSGWLEEVGGFCHKAPNEDTPFGPLWSCGGTINCSLNYLS